MIGDRKKRNNKCRNKICACTGACFVDDGTGDFAKSRRGAVEPTIALNRINSRVLGWDDRQGEIDSLRKALRDYCIATSFVEGGHGNSIAQDCECLHCDGKWEADEPEQHTSDCLCKLDDGE